MVYQSSSRSLLTFGRTVMLRPYIARNGLRILPIELICMILENLEMSDLINCILVSKFMRKSIKESSRLNYTIELAKNRMLSILPSACNPTFSTRLNLLRTREVSWKYLKFKQGRVLKLPPTGSVYEFVGGMYGNGREDETRAISSISFLELPSLDAALLGNPQDHELKVWTHTMDGVTAIDFTMDPAQDLLVLVALAPPDSKWVYELHLRSIRTNRPHPRSPVPILHCLSSLAVQPMPSEIVAAVRVQVFGDLVALLIKEVFESTGAHLEIWNWVTKSYSCTMFQRTGIDDFTFLTRDSFLLVRPGRFEVYDFTDPVKGHAIPTHRISYAFPTLSEDYAYWYISTSSNPAPGYIPHCQTNVNAPDTGCRQLYYPTPEDRIHACCIYILNPTNEGNAIVHSFVFFVNLKTLIHPPSEWLTQRCLSRRRRTRASRREPQIHEANTNSESNNNVSSPNASVPTHGSSLQSNSGSNSTVYPPFPTFDSFALPSGPTNDPDTSATVMPPPNPPAISSTRSPSSSSSSRGHHAITIPWKVWGPQSTRWFEECLSTDWQHAVYGSRTVESLRPEHHPLILKTSSGNSSPSDLSTEAQDLPTAMVDQHEHDDGDTDTDDEDEDEDEDSDDATEQGRSASPRRYLRIRNFNSFVFKDNDLLKGGDSTQASNEDEEDSSSDQETGEGSMTIGGTGKEDIPRKSRWNKPRLITEPSVTPVKGVFTQDIVSWLPYTEVISKETYEVTDVMMDDSRLLLLKRGRAARLKRVEVLMT